MSFLTKTAVLRSILKPLTGGRLVVPTGQYAVRKYSDEKDVDHPPEDMVIPIPPYTHRENEPLELKKARLLYQSRKRGMLENGILLSTFAGRFLSSLNEEQTEMYDTLINQPTNDWDIYDWIIKRRPVPEEYDTEIMKMIQDHAENKEMEERFVQPPLN